ncbi:MAG TPA: toll/interleukin-1 receptor domain-containing protein, partial [Anaerolineales bacterium]|nr:toll/interleukin-1 receptor domain-containing protein [Anaerolineales bacterium]
MNTHTRGRPLKVFLCHSSLDKQIVRELEQLLTDDGFDVWFDEKSLVPGQDWESKIQEILEEVDIIIVCLSNNSVNRKGFAQTEIRIAIDLARKQPLDDTIFLIPTRLDECVVPRKLRNLHWVDYFEIGGYSKLRAALTLQAKKSGLQIRPARARTLPFELVDYQRYPWQSFASFRYLESLDSTRFGQSIREPEIRLLSSKSELLESLLFGDGIALSEPQLVDSRGAVEALSELVKSAQECNVRIPIRVASRQSNISVFGLASHLVGMIDETQLPRRYIISANPLLDSDINRRHEWSKYLLQGIKGFDGVIRNSLPTESEFVYNLFTVLNYVDHDKKMVISAKREEERFRRELEQILSLTVGDLLDMCKQTQDAAIPDIIHPQWFANEHEADAASEVISGLQVIIDEIGGIPKV